MAVRPYHIQNVLRNYHRKLRARRLDDRSSTRVGEDGIAGMTGSTRREIERQVYSQIRRRLITRTYRGREGWPWEVD
jgi:hypothetical protein